jgi:RNA ligase (TIGR02306 family)
LSDRGLAFKFNDANENNLYIKAFHTTGNSEGDDYITTYRRINNTTEPFYILGEIYGAGVQDLTYGGESPKFRAFDVYIGEPGKGKYLSWEDYIDFCTLLGIPTVPFLYRGPFSYDTMIEYTDGKECVSGKQACIREGLVIRPVIERKDLSLGRVLLKSVSDKYLTRKNGTEFN